MIKKFGITIGGLQQKILNLVLVFIIVISGVYLAVSVYQSRVLSATVGEANEEQHQSIEQEIIDLELIMIVNYLINGLSIHQHL